MKPEELLEKFKERYGIDLGEIKDSEKVLEKIREKAYKDKVEDIEDLSGKKYVGKLKGEAKEEEKGGMLGPKIFRDSLVSWYSAHKSSEYGHGRYCELRIWFHTTAKKPKAKVRKILLDYWDNFMSVFSLGGAIPQRQTLKRQMTNAVASVRKNPSAVPPMAVPVKGVAMADFEINEPISFAEIRPMRLRFKDNKGNLKTHTADMGRAYAVAVFDDYIYYYYFNKRANKFVKLTQKKEAKSKVQKTLDAFYTPSEMAMRRDLVWG